MKKVAYKGQVHGHQEEKVKKIQASQSKRLAKARAKPIDPTEVETYDYIIVGAGTAGCVLAYQLAAGTKNRVLVVENGPPDSHANDRITIPFLEPTVWFEPSLDYGLYTADQEILAQYSPGNLPLFGYHYPRVKVWGGQSSSNSMIYIRGRPDNYDDWAKISPQFKGVWDWQLCLEAFKACEDNARPGISPEYHGFRGKYHVQDQVKTYEVLELTLKALLNLGLKHNHDFNTGAQAGAGFFQVNQKNGRRAPQYEYLKDALTDRVDPIPADKLPAPPLGSGDSKMAGLNVRSDSLVTRILFDDPHNKTKATGVEYLRGKFLYHAKAAKEVIVCAGAIHSPHILMLSGIGDSYKLSKLGIRCLVDNKNVGQHFKEHAIVPITASTTLPSQVHNPIYTSNGAQLGAYVKMKDDGSLPDLKDDQSKADMQFNIAADCWDSDILDKGFKGNALTVGCCFNEPLSEGWLEVTSADPTVQPLIYLNSFSNPADLRKMISGVRFAKKLLEDPMLKKDAGVENLSFSDTYGDPKWGDGETDAQLEIYIRYKARTSFHPMCSARMAKNAQEGVVDAYCKVYGCSNLRVIDSSVFPDYISGNLNAPTAMLAYRMGELIKKGH